MSIPGLVKKAIETFEGKSLIFDFGAHDGSTSRQLANAVKERGQVIAWEAHPLAPDHYSRMKFPSNLEFVFQAVNDYNGVTPFHVSDFTTEFSEKFPQAIEREKFAPCSSVLAPKLNCGRPSHIIFNDTVEVPCQTLDAFCESRDISHINLIWADIQGGESLLVKGGQESFKNTDYFYSELMPNVRYEGMVIDEEEFMSLLPGKWEVLWRWEYDIFFKNVTNPRR